jgi:hypothetical protein
MRYRNQKATNTASGRGGHSGRGGWRAGEHLVDLR